MQARMGRTNLAQNGTMQDAWKGILHALTLNSTSQWLHKHVQGRHGADVTGRAITHDCVGIDDSMQYNTALHKMVQAHDMRVTHGEWSGNRQGT